MLELVAAYGWQQSSSEEIRIVGTGGTKASVASVLI